MTLTLCISTRAVIEDARRRQRRRRVATAAVLLICLALGLVILLRPSSPGSGSGSPAAASSAPAHRSDGSRDAGPAGAVACTGPQLRIAVSAPAKGVHPYLTVRPTIVTLTQLVLHRHAAGRAVGFCLYPVPARG
jgi:hypothetical protein